MLTLLLSVLPEEQKVSVEKIFHRYKGLFQQIAFDYVHDKNRAEDIVQESLVKIILHIDDILELSQKEQKNYCAMIVQNTARDMLRKESVRRSKDTIYDVSIQQEDATEDIPKQMVYREIIEKALHDFTAEEKRLLYLKCGYEMSYKEVARLMGISEDAAKKRGMRLIKKIRSAMEQREDEWK